jgi:hypothetical protein
MNITTKIVKILKSAADKLSGTKKRMFMAETVNELGYGAQSACEKQLGWCRNTIRKGQKETKASVICIDNFQGRGRKKAEEINPRLLADIKSIVEPDAQADPAMNSDRLYIKFTANEVRKQLKKRFGYEGSSLPSRITISRKLNQNGWHLKKVRKTIPKKKIPETDDIFDSLKEINDRADESDDQFRISFDAKAAVKIGNLSRGGKNRVLTQADDHDFGIVSSSTPVAIYLPKEKDLFLYMVRSKVTSDCYVDIIEQWWKAYAIDKRKKIKRLVVNLDNGPEQSSLRTQFMLRVQELSDKQNIEIELAYYPPYHSKYNSVERTLGSLEQHWSGEILDSEAKVVGFAKTMSWCGKNPHVEIINKIYQNGVKVKDKIMKKLRAGFKTKEGIEKWSMVISPSAGNW